MKWSKYIVYFSILLFGCEKIVDVKLNEVENYLVVDAWLTHANEDQTIRLTSTQPYYDNTFASEITGATVNVYDDTGLQFQFNDQGNGDYVWAATDTFGTIGKTYFLEIVHDNISYYATSILNGAPPIDSITFTLEEGNAFFYDYYYSEFFGVDPEGSRDAYWLKAWKNGAYLDQPDEMYLFFDASFAEGNVDGIPFIYPIRTIANPFDQDINGNLIPPFWPADTFTITNDKVKIFNTEGVLNRNSNLIEIPVEKKETKGGIRTIPLDGNPYSFENNTIVKKADSIYLELHSISPEAWFFLVRGQQETARPEGFGALFATPPANLPTNIIADTDVNVIGFFNVASVSTLGRKLTSDAIREQPK
ncbi:MAG: DUF4249 domain-containing protein [Bacteroidota bacterium]